jgi:peptide/nickel transport system substrate-binding protein
MRNRISWVVASCLIALVLVITSCGSATTTQTTAPTTVQVTAAQPTSPTSTTSPTTIAPTKAAPTSSISTTPVYGGVITVAQDFDTNTFDDCYTWSAASVSWSVNITNDELLDGDWSAGPAGRGETTWLLASGWDGMERFEKNAGLSESWEMSKDAVTWTFHLRKGARFAVNPSSAAAKLVNGREITADDVVASMNRQWSIPVSHAATTNGINKPISITATDKYTVVFKWKEFAQLTATVQSLGDLYHIWPKEALATYNNDMRDWRLSVGTGPFILTDYVKGSSATYVKNPDFWKTYNIPGPGFGKQLPFIDGLKVLVITDKSTRMAAMRTGKVDQTWRWLYEDYASLSKSNPEFKDAYYVDAFGSIYFKMEDNTQPWANLKVRQALLLATDLKGILKDFYQGHGAIATNASPMPEYKDLYIPMENLPVDVQELYTYNPDKAKQYLKDAGYANGFTCSIVCNATMVDLLSVIKDQWSKVGVTLTLDLKDAAVYNGIRAARSQKELLFGSAGMALLLFYQPSRPGAASNYGNSNDPKIMEFWQQVWDEYLNWDLRCKIFKDSSPYVMRQVYQILTPFYEIHTIWQPWIMGYHGEFGTGNSDLNTWTQYVWLDLGLK